MAAVAPLSAAARATLQQLRGDFEFYAPRILKLKTKEGGVAPFILNSAQIIAHRAIEDQRRRTGKVRMLILKGRQQGVSTLVEGRYYWKASGEFGKNVQILTHRDEATANLFQMARRFHDLSPKWLQPHAAENSASSFRFSNLDSQYAVATAGPRGAGRSTTAHYMHGSEVAFWNDPSETMMGVGQIVPNAAGTEIILESTANGIGNFFHTKVMDALDGRGEYELCFIPWMVQTEYRRDAPRIWRMSDEDEEYADLYKLTREQAYWRRLKIDDDFEGNETRFDQEYPATIALAFRRVEGDPFIPMALVERAQQTLAMQGVGPRIMGVDPAEYGADSTAILIRQGRNGALYFKRVHGEGQPQLAGRIGILADQYQVDAINIDVTGGYGGGIADLLIENGYNANRIGFGERAIEDDKFPRRAEEMWAAMKDWLVNGPVKLPKDPVMVSDLTMRQYSYDSSRRLVLEKKEKMKARGLKSPDAADALALTFAMPVRKATNKLPKQEPFRPGVIGY